jgi:hypothetical protein
MTETPPLIRDMGQAKYEKGTSVSGSGLRPGPWTLSAPGGERDRSAPAGPSARGELPLALRALAISGGLVALMANELTAGARENAGHPPGAMHTTEGGRVGHA